MRKTRVKQCYRLAMMESTGPSKMGWMGKMLYWQGFRRAYLDIKKLFRESRRLPT